MNDDEYKKEYGYKKITWETFLSPAEPLQWLALSGAISPRNAAPLQQWVEVIQTPVMNPQVPKEVRDIFEVAKGCITYGVLFYPLFSIGTAQLFRMCETAVKLRAEAAGGHSDLHFKDAVDLLIKHGVIEEQKRQRWDALRSLRNSTSHPKMQMILPPANAIHFLETIADDINAMY